jgi:putative sporulation protein YtaF
MSKFDLLPIFLLALSSNGDNIAVGIAYGLGRIKVSFASNLLIAFVTGLSTALSMWAGREIGSVLNPKLAGEVGGALIVAIGVWVILQSSRSVAGSPKSSSARLVRSGTRGTLANVLRMLDDPLGADKNFSRRIEIKEGWVLAIALSLNNTVNGLAAGMLRMNAFAITSCVMVFSVLTLSFGLSAGRFGKRWLGNFSGVASGVILISLGIYEIYV